MQDNSRSTEEGIRLPRVIRPRLSTASMDSCPSSIWFSAMRPPRPGAAAPPGPNINGGHKQQC